MRRQGEIFGLLFFWNILMFSCQPSSSLLEEPPIQSDRILEFSGIEWIVRDNKLEKAGPGPNLFSNSEENVWVDEKGRLHLRITQKGGEWYCSGITAKRSFGYGKYVFYLNTDVSMLDENVVVGLFTYENDDEEIDIEFSRWSDAENQNAQFAVQPSDIMGNKVRFDIPKGKKQTLHSFHWQKDKIEFSSQEIGQEGVRHSIYDWHYTGNHIPPIKNARVKLNLWLFKGRFPTSREEQALIVDSVKYIPDF